MSGSERVGHELVIHRFEELLGLISRREIKVVSSTLADSEAWEKLQVISRSWLDEVARVIFKVHAVEVHPRFRCLGSWKESLLLHRRLHYWRRGEGFLANALVVLLTARNLLSGVHGGSRGVKYDLLLLLVKGLLNRVLWSMEDSLLLCMLLLLDYLLLELLLLQSFLYLLAVNLQVRVQHPIVGLWKEVVELRASARLQASPRWPDLADALIILGKLSLVLL